MRQPDHIKAAQAEAEKYGATLTWEVSKGNHIVCLITYKGKSRKVFCSKTPGDHRINNEVRQNVRHAIRILGGL
jgi:hypothetical protein